MAWLECEHTVTRAKRTVRLRKMLTTIGRAAGNDVQLDDPAITESQASLLRTGDQWLLAPNDRNATLIVNGQRTRKTALKWGDVALFGGWRVTLRDGEPKEDAATEEVASLGMMEELVQLSAEMMRETAPEGLFAALLRGLVKLTRAEKGFIILFRDGDRRMVASHNIVNDAVDLSRISDSIVLKVIETLQPLIVSDAMADARFSRARSVVDLKLSSVMCVPLIHQKDLLGVIYLGNDAITGLFTDRDLTLLRIYASQAALVVSNALLLNQLQVDNQELRKKLESGADGEVVGQSQPMKSVANLLARVAPTDLSVLVLGETGTGKELVARDIHLRSGRASGPFVAINCGAIPENLLESELFGHRKGAFTGADTDKIGRIESAGKGTLFLDEIGEMPMNLQVKLLRVLQERVIERVGDVAPRPVDIRVVSATNKDLAEMIRIGRFREDLYYRLNELTIRLPPLRERGEDIVLLAQYFLRKHKDRYGGNCKGFTNQALAALKGWTWPGNVRELESRIKKALILSDRALLNPDDLDLSDQVAKRHVIPLADAVEQFRVDYIKKALELNNGNKAQTARDLGVDARTIFRYVEKIEEDGA